MVMGYEAGQLLRRRSAPGGAAAALALAGVAFVPALLVLAVATPGALGGAVRYGHLARKLDLLFSVFHNYSRPFAVACSALFPLALIFFFRPPRARPPPPPPAPFAP